MRIAVSIWEGKISPVLDTASKLLVIESNDQREVSRFEAYMFEENISRRCHFIRGLDLDVLICGAASHQLSGMLNASGIDVISGISGPAEDIIEAYLQETLGDSNFFMPGFNNHTLSQQNKP